METIFFFKKINYAFQSFLFFFFISLRLKIKQTLPTLTNPTPIPPSTRVPVPFEIEREMQEEKVTFSILNIWRKKNFDCLFCSILYLFL